MLHEAGFQDLGPQSIYDYKFEDFEMDGYEPNPSIKGPVTI